MLDCEKADYEILYLKAFGALSEVDVLLERAIKTIRDAQIKCEETYIETARDCIRLDEEPDAKL